MSRWKQTNAIAGYLVFGLPAVLAVPALVSTIARFGLWTTLTSAALPVLVVTAPLLLWIRYTRRRPLWRLARLGWTGFALLILINIAASPIWFWTGPVLAVLLSEIIRVLLVHSHRGSAAHATRPNASTTVVHALTQLVRSLGPGTRSPPG